MIVQSTPGPGTGSSEPAPHLVLTMQQHTATAGDLARHFGAAAPAGRGSMRVGRVEPYDLVVALVTEHDRGWVPVDDAAPRRGGTGLPWSVYQTPTSISIGTGPRSVDHNEARHPYRGLLSSMHIVGLYTGRYGLDGGRILDVVGPESRALLEPMIASERQRQARLTGELEADPATAPWMGPVLFRNYKALQFFDRLSLWLQVTHPSERQPATLPNVPTTGEADGTVTVTPVDERVVSLDPFPFDTDPLEITIEGRWLAPQPPEVDLAVALAEAPVAHQPVTLVSGAG